MEEVTQRYDEQALALGSAPPLPRGATLVSRLSRQADNKDAGPWYASPWVTIAALYAFIPFGPIGIYLMWRYRPWPRWLKWLSTIAGPMGAIVGFFITRHILRSLPVP